MTVTEERRDQAGKRKVDAFVFDCVCHLFNFDKKNAIGPPGELFDEHLYAFHQLLSREGEKILPREEFFREWSVDEVYEMVIEGSDTDMIVAQPLPLTDLFHDGLSPWEKCAEMAQKHPDKAVFWGSVNPLEGKKAIDLMTRQVEQILYGGEAPIWHPQWALEEFWNFELPRDIVEERGYPQLTDQAKRKILGLNLARLHGLDVPG